MKVTRSEAEKAVKTLLTWVGENTSRAGLKDTPARVLERYKKLFDGYSSDLDSILAKPTMPSTQEMGMVFIPGIKFFSLCEHHLLPMIGEIHIAYLPNQSIAGIGTIIKIANCFSRKVQIQEIMNEQIAKAIDKYLQPKGVAVAIRARHYCVDREEVGSISTKLYTCNFLGELKTNKDLQDQFLGMVPDI